MDTVAMTDWKKYPAKRDNVLFILRSIQNNNIKNFISDEELSEVAAYLDMSLAELEGIVSFYSFFSRKARAKYIIRICDSCTCRIKGSLSLYRVLMDKLEINEKLSKDGLFSIERTNCLGKCDKAPNMMINERLYTKLSCSKLEEIIERIINEETNG